ncbi:MAG: DUF4423 domain-containing protein [Bacteriovoracia bacterium]
MGEKTTITEILRQHLADCQAANPGYSLRAMARDLSVSPASLSLTIAGKRQLSRKNLELVAAKLGLSPMEVEKLRWDSPRVSDDQARPRLLREDEFRLIADWYYFAILNLAKISNKAEPAWISKRLGIPVIVAATALERLVRMELLEVSRGRLRRTSKPLSTTNDIPSNAIRNHHRQNLKRAELALENVAVERREFFTKTAAVNTKNLPKAKAAIRRFQDELIGLLENGDADEVYTLGIQLFPVILENKDSKGAQK